MSKSIKRTVDDAMSDRKAGLHRFPRVPDRPPTPAFSLFNPCFTQCQQVINVFISLLR